MEIFCCSNWFVWLLLLESPLNCDNLCIFLFLSSQFFLPFLSFSALSLVFNRLCKWFVHEFKFFPLSILFFFFLRWTFGCLCCLLCSSIVKSIANSEWMNEWMNLKGARKRRVANLGRTWTKSLFADVPHSATLSRVLLAADYASSSQRELNLSVPRTLWSAVFLLCFEMHWPRRIFSVQ